MRQLTPVIKSTDLQAGQGPARQMDLLPAGLNGEALHGQPGRTRCPTPRHLRWLQGRRYLSWDGQTDRQLVRNSRHLPQWQDGTALAPSPAQGWPGLAGQGSRHRVPGAGTLQRCSPTSPCRALPAERAPGQSCRESFSQSGVNVSQSF